MLSDNARKALAIALGADKTDANVADEIADAIDSGSNPQAQDVAAIADPSTATAEDCANSINDILTALKGAGLMA